MQISIEKIKGGVGGRKSLASAIKCLAQGSKSPISNSMYQDYKAGLLFHESNAQYHFLANHFCGHSDVNFTIWIGTKFTRFEPSIVDLVFNIPP